MVLILSNEIFRHKQLEKKLLDTFGADWDRRKFAVRSSAVGEDSAEMSAAGQMTTFLGIRGKKEIPAAIVKCWASQFALTGGLTVQRLFASCQTSAEVLDLNFSTAVNYKKQYGQELSSPMAVVVQEMVSAEIAGVMFTCDPVTSNPSRIFISANFGLGESVVSASADPDTYSFQRQQGEVALNSKTVNFESVKAIREFRSTENIPRS